MVMPCNSLNDDGDGGGGGKRMKKVMIVRIRMLI